MQIREISEADFEAVYSMVGEVAQAGDSYAYPSDMSREMIHQYWVDQPRKTFVCLINESIAGVYYLKTNQQGPGAHVCNAGFITHRAFYGQGAAGAMCHHAQEQAKLLGYQAMQFNFVASSNSAAVHVWQKHSFDIVGRLPNAFNHPQQGLVDALVMYKWLAD